MTLKNRRQQKRFNLINLLIWIGIILTAFGDRPFGIATLKTTALSQQLDLTWRGDLAVTQAQIIPDNTLGDESSTVTPDQNINDLPSDLIEGGAQRGENLFHSFSQFSIEAGQGAYFANPEGIANIFSRVTGNDLSNIFGTLGVNGNADLFFINPNGIIFGENASLDVNGSFMATTASGIQFGEQGEFNAIDSDAPPLLTVQPSALFFNQMQPGRIESRSVAPAGTIPSGNTELFGLRVPDSENLFLIGGEVIVDGGGNLGNGLGGGLTAFGGRIELGGLAEVGIIELNEDGSTSFPANIAKANLFLENRAVLDVSKNGRGSIILKARDIKVSDSGVFAQAFPEFGTLGMQPGDIRLDATNNISIINSLIDNVTFGEETGEIDVYAEGNITIDNSVVINATASTNFSDAGGIKITTQNLIVENESQVSSSSFGNGNGGQITILVDSALISDGSAMTNGAFSTGDGGDIIVRADSLTLLNGGELVSATQAEGNAGNIEVNATEIVLSGTAPLKLINNTPGGFSSGFITSSSPGASGDGGTITVNTNSLQLFEGAVLSAVTETAASGGNIKVNANNLAIDTGGQILTSTIGLGDAGNIELNITESLSISGRDPTFLTRRESVIDLIEQSGLTDISADLIIDPVSPTSGIFANTTENSTGKSGSITIRGDLNNSTLQNFSLSDGGRVTVDSQGQGNGGELLVVADRLTLNNANISASTSSAQGGNVELQISDVLQIDNNSSISAEAGGAGDGGNIGITTDFLLGSGNSDIIANAFEGQGGFIQIAAEGIFGLESRTQLTNLNDITAFSQQNPQLDGIVEIITPDTTQSLGLLQLPENLISTQIVQTCKRGDSQKSNEFAVIGRGSLPNSPEANLESDFGLEDWRAVSAEDTTSALRSNESSWRSDREKAESIVEANNLIVNDRGLAVLTAKATSTESGNIPSSYSQACQLQK